MIQHFFVLFLWYQQDHFAFYHWVDSYEVHIMNPFLIHGMQIISEFASNAGLRSGLCQWSGSLLGQLWTSTWSSKAPFHVILMLNMNLNKKAKRIAKDINDTLVKLRVISDGFLDINYSFNISNIIGMVKGIERLIIVVALSGSNSNTSSCCSEKFREK